MIIFKDFFNIIRWNLCVWLIHKVRNTYNLEIGFWLRESWRRNLICIHIWWVLNIFLNFLEIWRVSNVIGRNYNTLVFDVNEVSYHFWFNALESTINIDYMHVQIFEKLICCLIVHWNNNLFVGEILCSYIDMWPRFVVVTTDDFLHLINFLVLEVWECFFDFQVFHYNVCCARFGWYLSIWLLLRFV